MAPQGNENFYSEDSEENKTDIYKMPKWEVRKNLVLSTIIIGV